MGGKTQQNHISAIRQALDLIERDLAEPISVASICSEFEMSPWQFQRVFRAHVGDSIGNYLRGRRLTRAAEMILQQSHLRILDIAIEMQFGSQETFARAFKEHFGINPTASLENRDLIQRKQKPRVEADYLRHIATAITREPEIRMMKKIDIVGMATTIVAPLSEQTDFEVVVPELWQQFLPRIPEICEANSELKYGLAFEDPKHSEIEKMVYVAGVPVASKVKNPQGMTSVEIPEGEYAVFEHVGLAKKSHLSLDYIYGVWLPQSDFDRGQGPDFETFDSRYKLGKEDSISHYFLPITRV